MKTDKILRTKTSKILHAFSLEKKRFALGGLLKPFLRSRSKNKVKLSNSKQMERAINVNRPDNAPFTTELSNYHHTKSFRFKSVLIIDKDELDNFIIEKLMRANSVAEHVFIKRSTNSAFAVLEYMMSKKNKEDLFFPDLIMIDFYMLSRAKAEFSALLEKICLEFNKTCKIVLLTPLAFKLEMNQSGQSLKYFHIPKRYVKENSTAYHKIFEML
jgi:hypothetical protein